MIEIHFKTPTLSASIQRSTWEPTREQVDAIMNFVDHVRLGGEIPKETEPPVIPESPEEKAPENSGASTKYASLADKIQDEGQWVFRPGTISGIYVDRFQEWLADIRKLEAQLSKLQSQKLKLMSYITKNDGGTLSERMVTLQMTYEEGGASLTDILEGWHKEVLQLEAVATLKVFTQDTLDILKELDTKTKTPPTVGDFVCKYLETMIANKNHRMLEDAFYDDYNALPEKERVALGLIGRVVDLYQHFDSFTYAPRVEIHREDKITVPEGANRTFEKVLNDLNDMREYMKNHQEDPW